MSFLYSWADINIHTLSSCTRMHTTKRSIMTYDEASMDAAYRNLEATEKFCGTGGWKLFGGPNPAQEALTPHERLYRQVVVADCLLYESILVFLRQGITSYVKGGYILRKAWKTYEKVFAELDTVCSLPCPLTQPGVLSPADEHVGTSVYDDAQDREREVVDGGGAVEGHGELVASLAAVMEGIGGLDLESRLMEMGEAEGVQGLSDAQVGMCVYLYCMCIIYVCMCGLCVCMYVCACMCVCVSCVYCVCVLYMCGLCICVYVCVSCMCVCVVCVCMCVCTWAM